jgi:hypothetical protein
MRVTLNRHCNNDISSFVAACMVELMLAYMWSVFGFSLKTGLDSKICEIFIQRLAVRNGD